MSTYKYAIFAYFVIHPSTCINKKDVLSRKTTV